MHEKWTHQREPPFQSVDICEKQCLECGMLIGTMIFLDEFVVVEIEDEFVMVIGK